jgi:hypothetical protein
MMWSKYRWASSLKTYLPRPATSRRPAHISPSSTPLEFPHFTSGFKFNLP